MMGGTSPVCPFCRKLCKHGGVKDHILAKHTDKYVQWRDNGMRQYWEYDENGELRNDSTGKAPKQQ